jgi:hypothetical protein
VISGLCLLTAFAETSTREQLLLLLFLKLLLLFLKLLLLLLPL